MHRCTWAVGEAMTAYHDTEWGRPQHDDRTLYEFLVLEGAQAGLSWSTILHRRNGYRAAFANFRPDIVAGFGQADVDRLVCDGRIIRNRLKIRSAINNAVKFVQIQREFGSFDAFIWGVSGRRICNQFADATKVPASTITSVKMSRILKEYGFTFVGPTICYAYMQAVGMVNDHTVGCFLHGL